MILTCLKVIAKKPCYAVFLDLKKAFPSVNRSAMFKRLATLGFPKKRLQATSAFYNLTSARLRIGVLLTAVFLINAGVSEGRVLSPLLFSLAFSIIWEKLNASPFPDKDYVFRADDFWLLAFADDLVVLASSLQKANEVLAQLMSILEPFDLEFSAVKSEGMVFTPGGRCSSFDVLSTNLNLGNEALKIVGKFKYLGVWVEPSLKFGAHLAAVEERARLASLETIKLILDLDILAPRRYAVLYRAFVESQLFGIELFPATSVDTLHRVRRLFLTDLYGLPADTSSVLANFLLRLMPGELSILKARTNFGRRLARHAVPAVAKVMELESKLRTRNVGWAHESFIVARHIKPSLRASGFSLEQFSGDLFSNFPDIDNLNFALGQKKGAEESALSFFCYLDSFEQARSFRTALGGLSVAHARLVLLFLFSGLRWRISRIPLKTCPYCPRFELLWNHFLECECVSPYMSAEFLNFDLLLRYVRLRKWRDVFTFVGSVIGVWCDLLSTCALDIDVVWALAHLP
jgi:hypothetical protein